MRQLSDCERLVKSNPQFWTLCILPVNNLWACEGVLKWKVYKLLILNEFSITKGKLTGLICLEVYKTLRLIINIFYLVLKLIVENPQVQNHKSVLLKD